MNREEKRKLQKKHKYVYSEEEFAKMDNDKQMRVIKLSLKQIKQWKSKGVTQ